MPAEELWGIDGGTGPFPSARIGLWPVFTKGSVSVTALKGPIQIGAEPNQASAAGPAG